MRLNFAPKNSKLSGSTHYVGADEQARHGLSHAACDAPTLQQIQNQLKNGYNNDHLLLLLHKHYSHPESNNNNKLQPNNYGKFKSDPSPLCLRVRSPYIQNIQTHLNSVVPITWRPTSENHSHVALQSNNFVTKLQTKVTANRMKSDRKQNGRHS